MVFRELKLKLTVKQERELGRWLFHLQSIYNWGLRKIELNAGNKIYFSRKDFQNLLVEHGKKLDIPSHVIQGTLTQAWLAWDRCFKKVSRCPRFKSRRNPLNSIPLPDPIKSPKENHIRIPNAGFVRYHKQELPDAKIKCGRIIRRASGWYLCLWIDAQPNAIPRVSDNVIGIDPGFKHLLTLSTGEKIEHPRELEATAKRLAQSQRGKRKKLTSRLQERAKNQRKDRNHKLSRLLVSENGEIYFSADNHSGIAKRFGKSVSSSGHGQLRRFLAYKCLRDGRKYVEVESRKSTMTCSTCGSETGPTGLNGLAVRFWDCSACGAHHDRDVNAAMNTLKVGLGFSLNAPSTEQLTERSNKT